MKYIVDHDLHLHSSLSSCSDDPRQTPERILQYAVENGYKTICLTDHFWDETVTGPFSDDLDRGPVQWYAPQNFAHICESKPLPQAEGTEFLFGAETDMTKDCLLCTSPAKFDEFAFLIIPVSHFHMRGFSLSFEECKTPEGRANRLMTKLEAVLNMDLPFRKVGLAHIANYTIGGEKEETENYCRVLELLMGERMKKLFTKAAALGVGIELNLSCMECESEEVEQAVLRFYALAKECGCKFYFGSDAHHPEDFSGRKAQAERIVELLGLTEEDKFRIGA